MALASHAAGRFSLASLATAALIVLATPTWASASAPEPAPPSVRAVAGAGATEIDSGLYRVDPEVGAALTTHGPDSRAAIGARAAGLAAGRLGFAEGAAQRPAICATDFYQRAIYARPPSAPDRLSEATAEIRTVIGRMNAVLDGASIASGGPDADYKVLCDETGQVRVDPLVVDGLSFADVVSAARAAGYSSERASLLVFVDGAAGGSCGIASYEADERLSIENRSNSGGGFALVYEPCWETEAAMHESAHLMGAVQYSAPNSTGTGGHCNQGADVMCYSPDGGDLNQGGLLAACPGPPQFDCGFDDYFDSATEPGEYLASHWNLGSPLNRFVALAAPATAAPAAAEGPAAPLGHRKRRSASGAPGDWQHFAIRVPRRADRLKVRLFAGPGTDLGLFIRHRGKATRHVFACRDWLRARHATCRIDDPPAGRWDAGVLTRGGRAGVRFRIRARARG